MQNQPIYTKNKVFQCDLPQNISIIGCLFPIIIKNNTPNYYEVCNFILKQQENSNLQLKNNSFITNYYQIIYN